MSNSANMLAWRCERQGYAFQWDIQTDRAELRRETDKAMVWSGSLLPLFWIQHASGAKQCVKATAVRLDADAGENGQTIHLQLEDQAKGALNIVTDAAGIRFERLTVEWAAEPAPAIIDLHFGASPLTEPQRQIVPTLERPFWPNWESEGFCIPSAKGSPIQSFFRCWDFGHATIPLGSFGPAMGTPYAAAFPRPLLAAGMGGANGWVVMGPGEIPDAALSLQIQSSSAMLHYRYREDLHGAGLRSREWHRPLQLAWSSTAWEAYLAFFNTFDAPPGRHQVAHSNVNSWGSFKTGDFDLRRLADRAVGLGSEMIVIDDFWERARGIGEHDPKRFPEFDADLKYARSKGLGIGFWQSIGWIDDPSVAGLTDDDLLCGVDGKPRRANWAMNPHLRGTPHYCIDPSSERSRAFLIRRTESIMRQYKPVMLKLDFGYGLPGPDVSVARNPKFRGERMAYELLRLIADAARGIDPAIRIQYYGIHPLMRAVTDVIALDDLGDAGNAEAAGHGQWAVWSALASQSGAALMASSGYEWEVDTDILLNTAIVGSPGCVLPMDEKANPAFTTARLHRRRAISRWHRRTTRWQPLWLDSHTGSLHQEPLPQCWGRLESFNNAPQLTSLVLRSTALRNQPPASIPATAWEGRWAVISQDNLAIQSSHRIACIPFDAGHLVLQLEKTPQAVLAITADGERKAVEATIEGNRVRINTTAEDMDGLLGYLIVRE